MARLLPDSVPDFAGFDDTQQEFNRVLQSAKEDPRRGFINLQEEDISALVNTGNQEPDNDELLELVRDKETPANPDDEHEDEDTQPCPHITSLKT